ncbi:GIY-YIG catalytic domain containing protein [Aphelenchoides avenae]|nr:GIY-YIG catalytic domain containing protein [Aphelenchus avenae]
MEGDTAFGNSSGSDAEEDDLIRDPPSPGNKSAILDGETEALLLDESFSEEAPFEDEQQHVRRSLKRFSFGVSPMQSPNNSPAKKKKDVATTLKQLLNAPGRIDLNDLSDPLLTRSPPKRKKENETVQDEFFGVYCLISRSPLKQYKNRCYIGYTVDPNRRIRQHNAGKQFGGAGKTDNRGPWDMVCITHGFPNSISALRFEWAWQNPDKSKRLKHLSLNKSKKESPFAFRLRVLCHMLTSDPWRRLALTFRWILPECEIPFPADFELPAQLKKAYGVVEKANTVIPATLKDYTTVADCHLCRKKIKVRRNPK